MHTTKEEIVLCKQKKKNSNFNRHTSERSYCGRKNAYQKKRKRKLNFKSGKKKTIQCSQSSSEDDFDVAICFDESDISFSEDLNANDYNTKELQTNHFMLCKFSMEKWRIAMYLDVEYEVKFLRKSYWGGFTFPNVADICDVAKSNVVLKLPSPQTSEGTSRAGRQLSFSVDLTRVAESESFGVRGFRKESESESDC